MKNKFAVVVYILSLSAFTLVNAQWSKVPFPTSEYLYKVRFANVNTGWIVGSNYVYRTTNGGSTWTPRDTSLGFCDALVVLNEQTAIFSNYTGSISGGIRRTTDGGTTWSTVDFASYYYTEIEFPTESIGYISGGTGVYPLSPIMRKTTNGGETWTTVSELFPKAKSEITGIAFSDVNTGWAVTYDGFVYQTTNGGTEWSLQDSLGFYSFRDIDFVNTTHGWIVGGISGFQHFARTTNGGETWISFTDEGSSVRETEFLSITKGWYVGMVNTPPYVATIDSDGAAWIPQTLTETQVGLSGFESIDMINENVGWIVGPNGCVFKTTNGGVTFVRPEDLNTIPSIFSLEQNYPNPFNPTTTFEFSLPLRSKVEVAIYNALGQKITTVVNTIHEAGQHRISWNGRDGLGKLVASGIYFYQMKAGSFQSIKKMVLMK